MRRVTKVGILLLAFAFLVSGCSGVFAEGTRVIEDNLGREVQVPEEVERIVGLEAGALRLITYLQATDMVVGVEDIEKRDNKQPYIIAHQKLTELPSIGPIHGGDPELIVARKPDVIFWTYTTVSKANNLQKKTGIPVVALTYGGPRSTIRGDLYGALRLIGEVIRKEDRAEEVIDFINGTIEELGELAGERQGRVPEVYVGGIAYRGAHGISSTEPAYPPFEYLGIDNVASELGLEHASVNEEKLLQWNPEWIFVDEAGLSLVKKDVEKPQFKILDAVKKGRTYGLLPYNWYTTNFGTVLADAYYVGKVLFPEAFADVDPVEKADGIYEELVGEPVYDQMAEIFGGFKVLDLT